MSVGRDVIAETLNIKEDVSCKNCSAHEDDGLFLYCNAWKTTVKSFEYCSLFLPEGTE